MRLQLHRVSRLSIVALLVVFTVLSYIGGVLLDEDRFAEIVGNTMDDDDVRTAIAATVVDTVFNAIDVNTIVAGALPQELSIAASPALELTKPVIAEAGSQVLALPPAKASVEQAARSIHRQVTTAALAEEETPVVINTRPILVVVADEIAGPAGARAAVGLHLPESATSVNLGSNRSALWTALNSMLIVSGAVAVLLLIVGISYFITAESRFQAAAGLGRVFLIAGAITIAVSFVLTIIVAVAAESLLGSSGGFSVAGFSFGTVGGGGGLGTIVTSPLAAAARRLLYVGLAIMFGSRLLTDHPAAVAFRSAVRHRDINFFGEGVAALIPDNLRRVQYGIYGSAALFVWFSSGQSLRTIFTLIILVAVTQLALIVSTDTGQRWQRVRDALGWDLIETTDSTDRTPWAQRRRRTLVFVGVVVLVLWPSYDATSVNLLTFAGLVAVAWTFRRELGPPDHEIAYSLTEVASSTPVWRRPLVVAPVLTLAFAGLLLIPGPAADLAQANTVTARPSTCNGLAELCARTLDEVVFAGTHNAMSAEELGWELANHGTAIPAQLDGGVRALLVDVQLWEVDVSLGELDLDPDALEIARRALSDVDPPEDGLWMCHKLCQLGGTPFRDFVADIRVFLDTNPDEVLIIVIQDEAPKEAIKKALVDGGLDRFAYPHVKDTPWPTLGEMISDNTRVVFMAENEADADGWYQPVYEGNVTETNFRYSVVSDFECAPNRGDAASPLFLINHWVETGVPVPSDADVVNSRAVLMERVENCESERGRLPGVIAVNFWDRGDLIEVVEELNRR